MYVYKYRHISHTHCDYQHTNVAGNKKKSKTREENNEQRKAKQRERKQSESMLAKQITADIDTKWEDNQLYEIVTANKFNFDEINVKMK